MTEYSLWGNTGGNNNADNNDSVTLGTKIRTSASVPLWCLGLRYYRGTLSAGTKTGQLFRTSGSVAVSEVVTFTDSGLGWQEKRFNTPVAVSLNTLYTPSVLFPNGQPSFTGGYFANFSVTNGPITAPSDADAPGQGVFTGGSTLTCPINSFNQTCYWIDWIVTDANPFSIVLNGVPSTAAVGQPTLTAGPGTITPNGVPSSAAVGNPALLPGPANINLTGIASGSAVGQPTLIPGPAAISLTGVPSAAQVGQPAMIPGPAAIRLNGIPSASAVGLPRLSEPGSVQPDRDFRIGPPHTGWRIGPPHQ